MITTCPRSSFNNVVLRDCQDCRINRPYKDAQNRLLWRDKTCPARTYLIELESVLIIIIIITTCAGVTERASIIK